MQIDANNADDYIAAISEERRDLMQKIREIILANLPDGFLETITYGMISYVVPHSIYPKGYHCDPKMPFPFISIASQKNFIGLYHMGIYSDEKLLRWFKREFAEQSKHKLDMGKSCIRFKYFDDIPFNLIADLVKQITVNEWISFYEDNVKKRK